MCGCAPDRHWYHTPNHFTCCTNRTITTPNPDLSPTCTLYFFPLSLSLSAFNHLLLNPTPYKSGSTGLSDTEVNLSYSKSKFFNNLRNCQSFYHRWNNCPNCYCRWRCFALFKLISANVVLGNVWAPRHTLLDSYTTPARPPPPKTDWDVPCLKCSTIKIARGRIDNYKEGKVSRNSSHFFCKTNLW